MKNPKISPIARYSLMIAVFVFGGLDEVSQVVDIVKGIHGVIPKQILLPLEEK